mgnify:CR=1 FL=1
MDYITPITAGVATAFIMGPVFWVLLETSITKGFRAAVAFDLGVIISDIVFVAICIFASSKLTGAEENQQGLYLFGGTILMVYGLILLFKKKNKKTKTSKIDINKHNYLGLAIKGFALNIINVGVLLYWLVLFNTFGQESGSSTNDYIVFFAIVLTTYFIVDMIKIILANKFSTFLIENAILLLNSPATRTLRLMWMAASQTKASVKTSPWAQVASALTVTRRSTPLAVRQASSGRVRRASADRTTSI